MSKIGDMAGCGMQRVTSATLTTSGEQRARWRCELACGHSVNRRQDKPPEYAACERKVREASAPSPAEAKARRSILFVLQEQPGIRTAAITEQTVSASLSRAVCIAALQRLERDGAVVGSNKNGWRLTDIGRVELDRPRVAA